MSRELKVRDRQEPDLDKALKRHDTRLVADAWRNTVEIYTDNWCSTYEIRLRGSKPHFRLRYRVRCYR